MLSSEWMRVLYLKNLVGCSFIIEGKVERWRRPRSSSFLSFILPPSTPPPGWAGVFCPYMIKPGLSWYYGKIILVFNTMSVFHFEMSHFHKLLFLCVQKSCPRDL